MIEAGIAAIAAIAIAALFMGWIAPRVKDTDEE